MPSPNTGAETAPAVERPGGLRVLIVGAGFGGVAAAIELQRHGFEDIRILDGAPGVGGTWFYNSYPGAACDVPSHLYSYSYEQRRDWSRLCSPQEEILSYLRGVAREHGVDRLVEPSRRVVQCAFDEARSVWLAETETGERYESDVIVLATGQLNRPSLPRLPGVERFEGHSFHSARWDHAYDLRGKRVAVIGTGASAVQFVPQIAERVAHMTVYQRTGNWMLPRQNRVYSSLVRAAIKRVPPVQWFLRRYLFNLRRGLTLAIRHPRTVGRLLGLRSSLFMRRQLPDPELRAKVWPEYTFGCKRVLFSSHYLPALAQPNVELVTDAIAEVTESGLLTVDGSERQFDCIIWSTGFRASQFMAPRRVLGRRGPGPRPSLGARRPRPPRADGAGLPVDVPDVRNTNTSGGSIIVYLEAQAAYIRQALEYLRGGHFARLDVRSEAEAASDRETQARFAGTAWTECDSWYRDEQGRIVANWPGYMREYLERTRRFVPSEYAFSPSAPRPAPDR